MRPALVAFASCLSALAAGQARFNVSVEAVYLDVVVTDKEGRFYPGLTVEDFEVLEDRNTQELNFFTSDVTPVTVQLLLDSSSSIYHSLDGVKAAATNFLRRLREGDKAAVAFFNQDIRFLSTFTDDSKVLRESVSSLKAAGATALYDAVLKSLHRLSEVEGRKALLVFSDGADSRPAREGSRATMEDTFEGGRKSDASIYTIGFLGASPTGYAVNREFLKRLSQQSGGRAFYPKGVKQLNEVFFQIQSDLHSQYRMAYPPMNTRLDGSWRSIEIRIKGRNDLRVRARLGYYAKLEPSFQKNP